MPFVANATVIHTLRDTNGMFEQLPETISKEPVYLTRFAIKEIGSIVTVLFDH